MRYFFYIGTVGIGTVEIFVAALAAFLVVATVVGLWHRDAPAEDADE